MKMGVAHVGGWVELHWYYYEGQVHVKMGVAHVGGWSSTGTTMKGRLM